MEKAESTLFKKLFLDSYFGIGIFSAEGKAVHINKKYCTLLDYTADEMKGMVFTEFTHPDDIDLDWQHFTDLKAGKIDHYSIEKRYLKKDGTSIWVELTVELLNPDNKKEYVTAYITEIHKRKAIAKRLERTELLFENVFNNMFQFMGMMTPDGTLVEANKSALEFGGFSREQAVGQKFYDAPWWTWNTEVRDRLISSIKKAAKGEFIRYYEDVMGTEGLDTIDFSIRPVKEKGKVIMLIPEGRLIPQDSEVEKELLQKNLILENTEKLAKTGGWSYNVNTDKVSLTTNGYKLLGFELDRENIKLQDVQKQVHPEDLPHFKQVVENSITNKSSYSQKYRVITQGGVRHIKSFGEPWFNSSGELESLNGSLLDISDEVKAKETLDQMNETLKRKVEDLEQFAYISAHDLREPLRTIRSFIQILQEKLPTEGFNESNERYLNHVEKGAVRLHQLISDLLDYTRLEKSEIEKKPTNVKEVVDEVKVSLSNLISESEAEIEFANTDIPLIHCNKERLLLLFQNLISNAIKFQHPDRKPLVNIDYKPSSDYHHFSITDNGIGIKKENEKKVFEIFKRLQNKDTVEGTGIGLSICKKIIEQHSGKITLTSEYGRGTTINFTLKRGT